MTTLAVLVLGSISTVMAGEIDVPPAQQPAVAPEQQPPPAADDAERDRRARARIERRKQRHVAFNLLAGIGLEAGAALFYVGTGGFIQRDLDLTSAGCDAPDNPCGGPPTVLLIPGSATALGVLGATRFAAARDAALWRSPVFWAGTFVEASAYVVWAATGYLRTRSERLTWDTTFLATAVVGTGMQVWGALIAPPRDAEPAAHALHLAPGCAPTAGGVVCGLALAGF